MRPLVLALSLLAVAVSGCGGGSSEQSYSKDFRPVNRDLVQVDHGIARSFQTSRGKSDAEIGREFGRHADKLTKIGGELKGLHPPDKLAGEQSSLVRAIGRVQGALRGIQAAAGKKDVNAARRSLIRLVTTSVGMTRARQRLSGDAGKSG